MRKQKYPEDWELKNISEIGEVISGGTPKTNKKSFWGGSIAWLTPTDVTALKGNKYISTTDRTITEEGLKNSSAKLLPKNSLIVCTRATVGTCGINTIELSTNQGFKNIIPNDNVDIEYLYYLVSSMKRHFIKLSSGSTFLELSGSTFKGITIPIPPLSEQQKIAEILSTIDEKLEVIENKIGEAKELKKGLMQRLLTKGIGHTLFKSSPLGEIPESWNMVNLRSLLNNGKSITYGIVQPGEYVDDGVYLIRSQDYTKGWMSMSSIMQVSEKIDAPYSRSRVQTNDILITVVGANVGRIAVVPIELNGANISRSVARISINNEKADSTFVRYYLESNGIETVIRLNQVGGAQPVLNLKELSLLKIPAPPISEQKEISHILGSVDEKLQVLRKKKRSYGHYKKGLMQKLLSGQLRVNNSVEV